MKLIHLSDLHLGKRLNEHSLIEDQEYILAQILDIIDAEAPDAVLIAGDVYDKSIPPAEAVGLFDRFLTRLSQRNLKTFVISGNHDSPERISFGARLMDQSGVFLAGVYEGKTEPVTLTDAYGSLHVYLLPFVKPAHVRRFFEEEEIVSYTDALRTAVSAMKINKSERNILVTHQFVTGASRTESEEISVGGTDNVDASVFEDFDYVALGHIHSPQHCVSERIRYSGTPLKYSLSEKDDEKSVTVIELREKGSFTLCTVPLTPLHDVTEIRGSYEELTRKSFYEGTSLRDDYVRVVLTDEEDVLDAIGKLRVIYRNLTDLRYDNIRTSMSAELHGARDVERKSPMELFAEFYEKQNNQPMSEEQRALTERLISEIWGTDE